MKIPKLQTAYQPLMKLTDIQPVDIFADKAEYNRQKAAEAQRQIAYLRSADFQKKMKQEITKRTKANQTTSNDATANSKVKNQNTHLADRSPEAAKAHAAWEKEHPNLTAWGNILSAIPFAVAATPAVVGLGDAAATTAAGQAATRGLSFLTNAVKASSAAQKVFPWLNAGATSVFAAHGLSDVTNGKFTPETALELAPLGQVGKGFKYAWEAIPNVSLGKNATGDWNGWINVGNYQYRPNRSSLGMNKLIERRPISIEQEILLNPPENNVTENLLRWLGKDPNSKVEQPLSRFDIKYAMGDEKEMLDQWQRAGVDLSKISKDDVQKAIKLRKEEIENSAFNTMNDRYTLVNHQNLFDNNKRYLLSDVLNGEKVGQVSFKTKNDGALHIGKISNLTENVKEGIPATVHGTYERLLNSGINVAHSNGIPGIISGETLLSAPKTYHVLQKFRNRIKLGNYGSHSNENLFFEAHPEFDPKQLTEEELASLEKNAEVSTPLALVRAGDKEVKHLSTGPVYKVTSPTFHVPTRSVAFNPTIIDRFGKMHIDWKNPNIYRGLFPAIGIGTSLATFGNIENNY